MAFMRIQTSHQDGRACQSERVRAREREREREEGLESMLVYPMGLRGGGGGAGGRGELLRFNVA